MAANYTRGVLGSFSGKVGPVVGATWNGKNVMRSLPTKGNRIATPAQMAQRKKFSLVSQFVTSIKEVVNLYFDQPKGFYSKTSRAISYHLHEAVTEVLGEYSIDYQKVVFSRGSLCGLQAVACTVKGNGVLHFTYSGGSGQSNAKETDELVVLVYDPITKRSFYNNVSSI